jgi:hypothetical protein
VLMLQRLREVGGAPFIDRPLRAHPRLQGHQRVSRKAGRAANRRSGRYTYAACRRWRSTKTNGNGQ